MKKKISKFLSMILASVLTLSMIMTGFAAEDDKPQSLSSSTDTTFTITITGAADGETYTAYKIFDVTYTDEDEDGNVTYYETISSDSAWYDTVAAATDVFTLTLVSSSTDNYTVTVNEGVEDETIIAVFTTAGVPEGAKTAASIKASEGEAYLDVTDSGAGYYYITTTLGSLVMIDTTNPTVTIGEKNGIPTVSKWVHENTAEDDTWQHEDDASNNSEILFEIEIDNINGATNLVLHDSMDDELEIPDKSDFHMKSVVLYLTDPHGKNYEASRDKIELIENTDYTVSVGQCSVPGCELSNCAFELDFKNYDFSAVDDTGYIELTYELHLNTEGNAYENDYDEIQNSSQVSFGISSFSAIVYAETYSFGFEVYKYTGDIVYNETTGVTDYGTPLADAQFEVRDSDGRTAYFLYQENLGNYLFEGWGTPAENSGYTQTIISGSDGMVYIEGLDIGTYYLYETKAPDGYNALSGPVTVEIWATYNQETGAMRDHGVNYTYGNNEGTGVINIQNNTGSTLPGTGGMGTTMFYIVGIILILGAGVLFVTKKRLDKKDNNS